MAVLKQQYGVLVSVFAVAQAPGGVDISKLPLERADEHRRCVLLRRLMLCVRGVAAIIARRFATA
ncbi:hypothetical protein [Brenneria corticis]|uniref:Uncharacterized protein n=1 Tax=Brenneria corticis TaxID=2173106 RepID=A0A2U1UBM2_9GAMM|nr:hypothetical protein [Brenneria sp. CFCC 11842]PWC19002.1 hypothetical protein DDT56_03405 [Brenneria sp. CFCC 11842]